MGLLCTEVEIGVNGRNAIYYEDLGYEVPKHLDKSGNTCVKNGTKITVKVNDLPHGSSAQIPAECDHCKKQYTIIYNNYNKINRDGKIYCRQCGTLLFNTGENNPCYKKSKTDEEREKKRLYPEYAQFVKRVLARDNYTCQCCGKNNGRKDVHHLDGYEWCKDKRVDDTNGITLCPNCHYNFHAIYGNGGNTKEQFEEWIGFTIDNLEKFNGEIVSSRKIYCYEEDKIYNSATEFIRTHGLKATSSVYFVCNQLNFCKTLKGMHLFWYDKYVHMSKEEIEKIVKSPSWSNSKKVICLTTNKVYESIHDGARQEQASRTSITRCCDNEAVHVMTKDGRDTKWMYYDDYINNTQNLVTEE